MTTRFVVMAKGLPAARRAITGVLREHGVAWWHHFPDAWLVCDREGRTAGFWLDLFYEATPEKTLLVIVPAAGDLPLAAVLHKRQTKWLETSWKR